MYIYIIIYIYNIITLYNIYIHYITIFLTPGYTPGDLVPFCHPHEIFLMVKSSLWEIIHKLEIIYE